MTSCSEDWDAGIAAINDPAMPRMMGETIVCFGWCGWDPSTQTWNHVLERFAYRNRVVFVPPPLERTEVFGNRFTPDGTRGGLRHLQDNLYVYRYPRFLPNFYKPQALVRSIEAIRGAALRRVIAGIGGERPILYLLHPKFRNSIGTMNEKMVVYHVLDEYSGYLGANRDRLKAEENRLLDEADVVLCASELLLASKGGPGRNAHFVPNGVDFDSYYAAPDEDPPLPSDLAAIQPPRMGYTGRICDKLDFRLLRDIARLLPRVSFCFIGAVLVVMKENRILFEEWSSLPNVHLLGLKRVEEVPEYTRGFDVGLLPYELSEESRQRYPLKLHEYLAADRPVVSVPLPCVEEYADLVHTPRDLSGWVRALNLALTDQDPSSSERRVSVARRHDWNLVVLRIENLLLEQAEKRTRNTA